MINETNSCYSNVPPIYGVQGEAIDPNPSSSSSSHSTNFLYNLSILKDKVHQIQSLASIFMSDHSHESTAIAVPTIGTLIQEIIVTASSMMFACQQISHSAAAADHQTPPSYLAAPHYDAAAVEQNWYAAGDHTYNNNENPPPPHKTENDDGAGAAAPYDIIELNAADLLAKFTHYCAVCGKGFKRDANLRMHMRAHGEEYKSSAALSNPMKGGAAAAAAAARRKYSCPQEGCRWNKKHARFQPLKSMICVKNHYKRSHCPKMYVCKRCNRKQFSVLSDLRTHEKHCGDLKWQCSCGTTFSRKDKLMGHVALFVGHAPVGNGVVKNGSEVMERNR